MNTLRKEYLTYFDPEKNSNKFYSAELQQEDNNISFESSSEMHFL